MYNVYTIIEGLMEDKLLHCARLYLLNVVTLFK